MANGYMAAAARTDWNTPAEVIECVTAALGRIDLDPCSNASAIVNAARTFTIKDDGLAQSWRGRVYVNPPFDRLREFAGKAAAEHKERGCEVIMLMPSRTDTRAWHDHVASAAAVCFWKGRISFLGSDGPCPFPVALVYWGRRVESFARAFKSRGMILRVNGRE